MTSSRRVLLTSTVLLLGLAAPLAAAGPSPSSELLLPWFEVGLGGGRTTLFALGNGAGEAVSVRATVHTNWGIPVVERSLDLAPGEVATVNLRDWLDGDVPAPRLRGGELAHVQAALTGRPSPADDRVYASPADPFDPDLATGYVTFRTAGAAAPAALWGDYFWVDPDQDLAGGELLVDLAAVGASNGLCKLRRMRFLDGGGFDGGTRLVIWSSRRLPPAPRSEGASGGGLVSISQLHREGGPRFAERILELRPVQLVDVRELALGERFGWLDLAADEDVWVGVRYSANGRYSVALQSWCVAEAPAAAGPSLEGHGCSATDWLDHTGAWAATGFAPGQEVRSVFPAASAYPDVGSASLFTALTFDGGPGLGGAARALSRAAVAALLNAAHAGVGSPWPTSRLVADVERALASGSEGEMVVLTARLEQTNGLGCAFE